ncbi:hypothetical protein PBT90_06475 [Algoriphagus halophytocola]|uniref:hypothetical protein n=1 Tax=Algoriphagus halophytocola TaxID=2991499 RepID=UPI0022DDFC83|nr:hypothetical protein [Algoriphagus sp. TR-M9]WBL44329.1 hypothetical protein PBT90_06475 [Algoriphagus sp. TR-M9]
MKVYYQNIEFWDLLSLPLYFILLYLILVSIAKAVLLEDRKFINVYFLALLLFYLFIGLVDFKVRLIPYFPDTNLFTKILETGVTPSNQSIGVKIGYKFLAIPIYWLSLKSIFNYFLFNVFFFQIGIIFLAGAFNRTYEIKDQLVQRFYLILALLMPSVIVYSFTPLRESYFVLALGLFFYGLTGKNRVNIFLILGVILAGILRIQLLLYFFIVYVLLLISKLSLSRKTLITIVIVSVPILFLGLNFLSTAILNIPISPKSLALFRNIQRMNYFESGVSYPEVFWENWFDLIVDFPGLFLQFLLAPFPVIIFIPFWTKLAYFADGIYLLVILTICLGSVKYIKGHGLWLMYILLYVGMSSFFEFHLLGAVRHRLPATLLILGLAAKGLSYYFTSYKWIFRF